MSEKRGPSGTPARKANERWFMAEMVVDGRDEADEGKGEGGGGAGDMGYVRGNNLLMRSVLGSTVWVWNTNGVKTTKDDKLQERRAAKFGQIAKTCTECTRLKFG